MMTISINLICSQEFRHKGWRIGLVTMTIFFNPCLATRQRYEMSRVLNAPLQTSVETSSTSFEKNFLQFPNSQDMRMSIRKRTMFLQAFSILAYDFNCTYALHAWTNVRVEDDSELGMRRVLPGRRVAQAYWTATDRLFVNAEIIFGTENL